MTPHVAGDVCALRDAALGLLVGFLCEPALALAPAAAAAAVAAVEAARHGAGAAAGGAGEGEMARAVAALAGSLQNLVAPGCNGNVQACAKAAEEEAWVDQLLKKLSQSGARRLMDEEMLARVDEVLAPGTHGGNGAVVRRRAPQDGDDAIGAPRSDGAAVGDAIAAAAAVAPAGVAAMQGAGVLPPPAPPAGAASEEFVVPQAPPPPAALAEPPQPSAHYVALNGGGRNDVNFDPAIPDEYRDDADLGYRIREITETELIQEIQEKYIAAAAAEAAALAARVEAIAALDLGNPPEVGAAAARTCDDDELLRSSAADLEVVVAIPTDAPLEGRRPPAGSFVDGEDIAEEDTSLEAEQTEEAVVTQQSSATESSGRGLKGLLGRAGSSVLAAFGVSSPAHSPEMAGEAREQEVDGDEAPSFGIDVAGGTGDAPELAPEVAAAPPAGSGAAPVFGWADAPGADVAVYIPPGAVAPSPPLAGALPGDTGPGIDGTGMAVAAHAAFAAQAAVAAAAATASFGFAYVQQPSTLDGLTYAQALAAQQPLPYQPEDAVQMGVLPHALVSKRKDKRPGERPALRYPDSGDPFYPVELDGVVYDSFALKVVHERDRTGFEDSKEFPITINSIVAGRYQVVEYLGSAAFSRAVQCLDLQTNRMVCMKIIKNDKDFMDQSLDEIKILRLVNSNTESVDEVHCLALIDYMYHKEHLILVTELLRDNLYEFSKYNRENSHEPYFTLGRLQRITKQVLIALEYIHGLWLMHADLKPENILIKSYSRCEVKVIDFGSSCFIDDTLTSYIQSRSYRAPEVILGLPYDQRIDIWSLGCILAELWTGYVLFQNDCIQGLLARIIGIIGPFPEYMLTAGRFVPKYFTQEGQLYRDLETIEPRRLVLYYPKLSSLRQRLRTDDESFINFITSLLQVDPTKRLTAREALQHPWLQPGLYMDGLR